MTTKPAPQHTPTPWALDRPNYPGIYIETVNKDLGYVRIAQMLPINAGENAAFIVKAVNAYESDQKKIKALIEAIGDALCELDPDCNYDGSNYNGEPSEKGNSRIQTILALYKIIAQHEAL